MLDAKALGALTLNYARVTGLTQSEGGRVIGATVHDTLGDGSVEVRARMVLNTTGPWTDELLGLDPERHPGARLLRTTKGAHLVVPAERLPLDFAIGMTNPSDGRSLFLGVCDDDIVAPEKALTHLAGIKDQAPTGGTSARTR